MDQRFIDLDHAVPLKGLLGYLNFSTGKPDARFAVQVNDALRFLSQRGEQSPWSLLHQALAARLEQLEAEDTAFRETGQVRAVLALVFEQMLPAYRAHHADLLFHLSDRDLWQPLMVVRVFEAVLAQGGPWDEPERIVGGALAKLNDFVGHRPVAVLETRPRGEIYPHERVRPVPLFIQGVGVGVGPYHDLVSEALGVLRSLREVGAGNLLSEAHLDLAQLEELALDPRAYDHGHPVNRRPNYLFGEWDPDHIDDQGRYRRFVVRQATLDALRERVNRPEAGLTPAAALFDAGAVLAGTMLMAAATCGWGPGALDSTATLAVLTPKIARLRDGFYSTLLERAAGGHADRLRREMARTRQPFGGARQHLNQYLARQRARQLEHRHLALLFAEMGHFDASRAEAARIPTASLRFLAEISCLLTEAERHTARGNLDAAAAQLAPAEELLRRGIDCGALADPWNILGFQGLFPLASAREDSVRDTRIDDLIRVVEHLLHGYARVVSEAAAAQMQDLRERQTTELRRLAQWWDRFASVEVSGVPRLVGGEVASSAEHVAAALAHWRERGQSAGDLAAWRQHLDRFRSPEAFALVIDALLRRADHRAALALLMNWLNQAEQVPLEDLSHSFHTMSLRWMTSLVAAGPEHWPLVCKFFDYLEANAEEYWQVPGLESPEEREEAPEPDDLYGAAYEGMTYRDSADDEEESAVAEGPESTPFDLEADAPRLEKRLRFLATLARLWGIAGRLLPRLPDREQAVEPVSAWLKTAGRNRRRLLELLDAIATHAIPEPTGSHESMVEYDRRRHVREQLLYSTIHTCLDTTLVVGTLRGVLGTDPADDEPLSGWEKSALDLERALLAGDVAATRERLPAFVEAFRAEPLLFVALADGGEPRYILRARTAQAVIRTLLTELPRLGLLRETLELLKTARDMEQANPLPGRRVTEFSQLFQSAFQAVVECVVHSSSAWEPSPEADATLVGLLETLTEPFLALWIEHSRTLRLSVLESLSTEEEWEALAAFVRKYGRELFHARFLTLANLRGILHRGVDSYLDYLIANPDPLYPVPLIDDLDRGVGRSVAVRHIQFVMQALVENYEEYKDYNSTTTQSDYGDNLHSFLDFLDVKSDYERHAWQFRPLVLVHEVLAREGRPTAAQEWEAGCRQLTGTMAEEHLAELAGLEAKHGMRLRTVSDRLQERFVKPLAVDRMCALVDPAMRSVEPAAFARLQEAIRQYTETPTGVGLDVPFWLRRLEAEVRRVRSAQQNAADPAEDLSPVPPRVLSLDELRALIGELGGRDPEPKPEPPTA